MRTVAKRVSPVAVSSRGARRQPPSTTMRTPGTVSDVSAMLVASTTRRPSAGRNARSCSASGRSPCSGSTSAPQPSRADRARLISPMPGRKASTSPEWAASASRIAAATAAGRSRGEAMSRRLCSTATGNMRPALSITGAPISADSRAPSAVADMASRRSSGRSWRCRSRHSASARSPASARSCTSSRMTRPTPSSPGSDSSRRTSSPSVTTSIRVAALTAVCRRVRKPAVCPTSSPSSDAMRVAAARAARRRGSSMTIRPGMVPNRCRGASVVLPAPGGATRTALPVANAASSRGSTSVMGSPVSGKLSRSLANLLHLP